MKTTTKAPTTLMCSNGYCAARYKPHLKWSRGYYPNGTTSHMIVTDGPFEPGIKCPMCNSEPMPQKPTEPPPNDHKQPLQPGKRKTGTSRPTDNKGD